MAVLCFINGGDPNHVSKSWEPILQVQDASQPTITRTLPKSPQVTLAFVAKPLLRNKTWGLDYCILPETISSRPEMPPTQKQILTSNYWF